MLSPEEAALAKQASFGDDIMSQREAAVRLADMRQYDDTEEAEAGAVVQPPVQSPAQQEALPTWDEVIAQEDGTRLPTWDEMERQEKLRAELAKGADAEVLTNLPDTIKVAGFDVPVSKGTAAFWVGAGHGMTWAYRGVKQLMGIDEEAMKRDEQIMDALYSSSQGGMARGGNLYGALFEPLGMLIPASKSKTMPMAFAKGFGVGGTYGAMGYVNEANGDTRLGNLLLGGTLGGAFNWAFRGLSRLGESRATARAAEQLNAYELKYAEAMLELGEAATKQQGKMPTLTPQISSKVGILANERMGKGFSLIDASSITGRRIKPPSTMQEAQELVQFHKGTYKKSDLAMGMDTVAGIVSTRIRNISEPILNKLRTHDKNVLTNQHRYFQRVDKFLEQYESSFSRRPELKKAVDKALLDGDFYAAERAMDQRGGTKLTNAFNEVKKVLDELGDQAVDMGLIKGKLTNYFPRYITDHKKLLSRLGLQERSAVEAALNKATLKAGARGLSSVEQSDVINKALRGYAPKEGKSPFTKARSYKRIPQMLQEYYATPEESLHSYIRNMVNDIEKHKFFGRNLAKIKTGTAEIFDIDESVGNLLRQEMKVNPLSSTEMKELSGLLQTRFGIGERSPLGITQNTKNMLYISLLGNPISAATQLGDLGVSIYVNGFKNTMKALPKALRANWADVSVRDWGLTDQLAEEFATTKQTARWLHRAFKYSGFKYIDRLGKDTMINAAFNKFKGQVKSPKGTEKFKAKYSKYLGNEIDAVIKDLRAGKATERVQGLLFSELADVQPISLSEVPEGYLKLPNGRIMYMLKTFMLKQVDVLRRDAYNEIKKGNIAKGLYNAARYSIIMGAAGTGSQVIKDSIMYGPTSEEIPIPKFEDIPAEFGKNLLKTFGWSEYVMNSLKDGKPYKAATDAFAPPFEIIDRVLQADANALDYVPIYGKLHHYWFEGGAKKAAEKRSAREMKEMLDLGTGEDFKEFEDLLGE